MEQATGTAASKAEQPTGQGGAPPEGVPMAMPAAADDLVLGHPETRQRYLTAMQGYYTYMANGYSYRSRVFEWQLLSSRVIFAVVLALVGAGLYFAAIQFRLAMRASARPPGAQSTAPESGMSLETKLEVSATGVSVNSSVMGLIILVLSLAFFYLYLVFVYPITDVF